MLLREHLQFDLVWNSVWICMNKLAVIRKYYGALVVAMQKILCCCCYVESNVLIDSKIL